MRRDRDRRRRRLYEEEICRHREPGIAEVVELLEDHGFRIGDSCAGGPGHQDDRPFVRFFEDDEDKAVTVIDICREEGLPIRDLYKRFDVRGGFTPHWTLEFYKAPQMRPLSDA